MNSRLFKCRVVHERVKPRKHRFEYPYLMFLLDLDELSELNERLKLFSYEGSSIYNFRERDHLDEGKEPLRRRICQLLANEQIYIEPTEILLLTNPRVMGYGFNPISVYFLFSDSDFPYAVICEICNTFYERKAYVIDSGPASGGVISAERTKNFYISPFCKLDDQLQFRIMQPTNSLRLQVSTTRGGESIVHSTLTGTAIELTDANLMRCIWHYPLPTIATISRIHLQALKLFFKGIPFVKKEDQPELQTNLWRPSKSLRDTSTPPQESTDDKSMRTLQL